MLNNGVRPSTVRGVKRLARQIRKQGSVQYATALDLASQAAACSNFSHATRALKSRNAENRYVSIFITSYWFDSTKGYAVGRETLEVLLSKPILEICSKSDLKKLRGLGASRLVAADHLVCDELEASQERARKSVCAAVRALKFAEHTGLRPSTAARKTRRNRLPSENLPGCDHPTDWIDPSTGQMILIDEPYKGAPNEQMRAEWAAHHNWIVAKTSWPGMYNPYACDLYVVANQSDGYDSGPLIEKINSLPPPILSSNWSGVSVASHEVFVSPAAQTDQDKRRARSQGTSWPKETATTIPYRMMLGHQARRPAGAPGVNVHVEMGAIIKTVIRSPIAPYGVYKRMNSLRSTLEDWMELEIHSGELNGPEFFDVYYHDSEGGRPEYEEAARTRNGLLLLLKELGSKLVASYPNSAPLRRQLRRIEVSSTQVERLKS